MLIQEKMKHKEHFSESEKIISEYFLKHSDQLEKESVRSIASQIYVAPSSIVRFCQKLGFDGYNDFKEQYQDEIKYLSSHFQHINPNYPFEKSDKEITLANKIGQLYEETIKDCLTLLEHDTLQKVAQKLNTASTLYICASGAQVGLSEVFKDKMMRIGKHVVICQSSEEAYYEACYASQMSCFLLISYTGETERCLRVAKKLSERSMYMLAVTSYGHNSLSHYADDCLYASTREKLITNLGNYTFNICVMLLLDILYSQCFNKNYEKNLENKVCNSKKFETVTHHTGRQSDNPIIQENNEE